MKDKHRFSIISLLMAVVVSCTGAAVFSACGGNNDTPVDDLTVPTEHTHVYSEDYKYDETNHWHYCTVSGCEETSDVAEHEFDYENYTTTASGEYVYTCTVCGYELTESSAIYSVTITNVGGKAISGVDVVLRSSGGSKVSSGTSSTNGTVRFRNLASGTYVAYIDTSTLPVGYSLTEDQVTLTAADKNVTVILDSAVITDVEMPSSTSYSVGDVVYDFTVTCYNTDGSTYEVTLSDYLDKYDVVVINFFYTTCSPCRREVPYMEQAYSDYTSKVGLIAFDYTGYRDTVSDMVDFKKEFGLSFDFTLDSSSYYARYGVTGFPTTIIIDRYSCIAEIETGSNESAASWISIFDYYLSDNYEPNYNTTNRDDTSDTQVKSDVEMPSSSLIAATIVTANSLTTTSTFTFSNYSEDGVVDEYNWPWIIGTDTVDGKTDYITTSNAGIVGGYSIIVIDVTLKANQAVLFDYFVSTETDYDIFYVQVDTILQLETSGLSSGWETCLAYVAAYDGDYQITLYYQKDSSKNVNDDAVYVRNLRIVNSSEITASSGISADILYSAATNYADSSVDVSAYGEGYGYYNYVSVYLASDGYYRVDLDGNNKDGDVADADDPYLLADLYYATPWYSVLSVWYEVYGLGEEEINSTLGDGVYAAFEDYAWAQNNNPWGYVPVNEELHEMLVNFVAAYGRTTGDLLDEQWLEVCRYYVHYGAAHSSGDKCYALDNIAETYGIRLAKDIGTVSATTNISNETALTFTAEMETILVPRGNYYSFTVSKDGVYRIYSYGIETDSEAAPYAFLMDKDGNTLDSSESDDLSYVEGFIRAYTSGSITITGGKYTFTAKYSGTYTFTLTSGSSVTIYSAAGSTYLASGDTSFDLELEAGESYTFNLQGATTATLAYELSDDTYEFAMYVYLEAGQTYYVGCSFGSTEETGSYEVGVYYIGDELVYLATMTTDAYYTYREVTSGGTTSYEYYVPTRVSYYALNPDDNCWWTLDEDGNFDQLIYIDMVGTTWWNYYSSYTIETAIENNAFPYDTDTTDGVIDNEYGWTAAQLALLKSYLAKANANTATIDGITAGTNSLTGLIPAYNDLVTYINYFFNGGGPDESTTYAENAWMLAAYYVRVVDANS